MDVDFWNRRWRENDIGFHEAETNRLLGAYFDRLSLSEGDHIFVPLCGKTRDIAWLYSKNIRILEVESVRIVE
ncbi:MAG: thiopurine S-methyltransferase, partial [Verrucomicrobiota bacterium]